MPKVAKEQNVSVRVGYQSTRVRKKREIFSHRTPPPRPHVQNESHGPPEPASLPPASDTAEPMDDEQEDLLPPILHKQVPETNEGNDEPSENQLAGNGEDDYRK